MIEIWIVKYVTLLRQLYQNTLMLLNYKQQKFISHGSGGASTLGVC